MFMHFQHIITTLRKFDPNFNESEINSAITFSLKCSNNNIHREIAEIITSIYPDSNSVIAALRFFAIENNNLKSIKIEHFFSKEIFDIFYALTKLFKIHNIHSDVTSQKTIRLLSSLDSNIKIKVLLIRFAYLLHKIIFNSNISHIEYVWISKEISKIYVPLFKEIKVEKIKVALQNACFKNLHPRLYKTIISFLDREYLHYELVAQIINAFHNVLPATNIEYTISGRIKSPYSIAKKIVHKSSTIQQLYDIIGIRIIVEKEQECYDILGTIYKHYAYIPERYKNLIKFPRKNGYQSLHTVIINKDLRKVEVQIRTKIMHYIAEYGTASHSQYKMGLINISNIAYNILNRLILNILNQLTIIPILHGRINNGDKVYARLTNEVSRDILAQQLLNINLENKTFVNDKVPDIIDEWNDNLPLHDAVKSGCKDIVELLLPQSTDVNILDQHHKTPLHYVAASRQSRASTSVNIRTNEISSNPLESLDLDIEQESNNANDSGIVESDVEDEDCTTFNPRQSRASTSVNIRTNEISSNPLESLDLDIEQESNNANDSGIVESDVEDEDCTTFNPRQSRASIPVNIRTNEISSNPLESLDLDIEQESNNANDSGIVESDVEDEDYTIFNLRQSRASTSVNIRTNEISSNPLESLDLDIEQESNNANDSGIVESDVEDEDCTTFNPRQSRASIPVNIRTNEISSNPLESLDLDIEQESNNANDSGIVESDVEDEDCTTFNPRQSRASIPVNIRTNEISSNPLESLDLDIEQESNNANDSGIVESDVEDEDCTTFNPRQSRASIPVNIRTNEISSNPLESLDLDIEQESNNANDSGIVESDVEDEDCTTFNPRQSRASIPVNIRTNEISSNPLESLDLDIEQESNNANDSGIVESDVEDEDYTIFNLRQSRASTSVNIRTNEISSNPLESLDLDIEQESNNANDSGIVESDVEDEDCTTFNPRQSRASTPVNIRTNEISSNPLESLDLDIEQESNNANDSGIVESDVEDEDCTTFNPRQSRASIPVNIRTNEISSNPLESLDLDIEQESNNANDSGIVESDVEDEDCTTFNPRQSRASIPVNIRTNEISSNPLESLDLDIEQESNNANDSGIVESDVEDEDCTTFNPRQSRASTLVNIRTDEISTCINSTVDGTLINLANLPNLVGTSLDLSNKLLDDKDIEYLFKILLPETCITSLNLSNNILVCGKVNGIRYLTHLLNTRIASLNLSNNRLGQLPQEDIEHFISILPNTQITSLNLSNNQLTCQHLKYFAHTLPKTNIMLLDLSNNSLGGEEDMEDFINILSKTKITSLNLSDNNLDDADIYNLADILPNSRITNINLSYNDVTPDLHNEILIDALQQSPLITRFDIDDELLFSKANTIINQNQENNKNLFSIFNKIVCKDNNNLTLIKKGTIEVDEYFFVIKHLIKTTNVLYLLSTQYQINNTKMWFTEEELINFIQRIPSEFRELMTLLDCQVTTQVNVLQECEKNDMSEVVKELLLARELYKTNKEKNILHEYVYILLSKYELPIIHDGMCNNPSREDLIHHFQSNDYQENQEAQYVVSLLGNGL